MMPWLQEYLSLFSGVDRRQLVRCACACVRTVIGDEDKLNKLPLRALETAERWCDDKATLDEVRSAANAAAFCGSIAVAAFYAARIAYSEACETDAAFAVFYAGCTDAIEKRQAAHREMCAIIRRMLPLLSLADSGIAGSAAASRST
jgi:hypothetical protein